MMISQLLKSVARNRSKDDVVYSHSARAKRLTALQQELDGIQDAGVKQKRFDALSESDRHMLDALWSQLFSDRGRKNIPTSGGRWTGEPGDSVWIPDDNVVPPDKGYSNMFQKTWRQIKSDHKIKGIAFYDGRVDFKPVAKYEVVFDWERELGQDGILHIIDTGDRQYLHEAAFSLPANKLGKSVREVKEFKEKENLVWHEEPDCETLRLVSREVHDNIRHFGGIAMLAIVFER